jgi:CHAT domain-containing protein/tetratricopeptide (TPR) repeat protein
MNNSLLKFVIQVPYFQIGTFVARQVISVITVVMFLAMSMPLSAVSGETTKANIFDKQGNKADHRTDLTAAIHEWSKALELLQPIKGTERVQARYHINIGIALGKMGQHENAINHQEQALKLFQQFKGTDREQAKCHMLIGSALLVIGQYKEAITHQEQALKFYQQIKSPECDQAICYLSIGLTLPYMGKFEQGISFQEHALELFQQIKGTEKEQATCHMNIGAILRIMGQSEQGISRQEQALKLFQQIKGTEKEQAKCFMNIGIALGSMGQYKEAITRQEQALKLFQQFKGTEREQAKCHMNIGEILLSMGKYNQGISFQERALKLFQKIKDTEIEQQNCYGKIGLAYYLSGRFSKAIDSFKQAGADDSWLTQQGLGNAYRYRDELNDTRKALKSFLDAVRNIESMRAQFAVFENRLGIFEEPSVVYRELAGFLTAPGQNIALTEEPEIRKWSSESGTIKALHEAAFHYIDRGKGRALEDVLREKTELQSTRPDIALQAEDRQLSFQISKLSSLRKGLSDDRTDQVESLNRNIEKLQQRRNIIEMEIKNTVHGGYISPEYRKPMDMAKDLGKHTAVLQYSISDRENRLLILSQNEVTAHNLSIVKSALPELLPRQKASVRQLVQAWQERPKEIGLDGLVRLARTRVEDLGRRPLERHNLIAADQERAFLARLGAVCLPNSALTELRAKSVRHLLVIPDGSLHFVPFAMLRVKHPKKANAQYLIEEFAISYAPAMTTLETIRKHKRDRIAKRRMHRRALLAFANPDFGGQEAVVAYTGDDMVTRMRSLRKDYYQDAGLHLTLLPETEQEAVRACSLFAPVNVYKTPTADIPEGQAVVYTSKAASEEQVKYLLNSPNTRWQYLLFSTHGFADSHNGMLSCIALSSPDSTSTEDGFLQAQEVMHLDLDSDLAMLSACQTGLGSMHAGEGLVGLCAAFFYAGTESICASLWQVPSSPTSKLVTKFFKSLKEGKLNRAEALRQAQLSVLRASKKSQDGSVNYSDPFCWAAFTLQGEWVNDSTDVSRRHSKQFSSRNIDLTYLFPDSPSTIINSLSFSPNGRYLAVGLQAGTLSTNKGKSVVFDFETDERVKILPGTYSAFSPDGEYIASITKNDVVIWDFKNWQRLRSISNENTPTFSLAFDPKSRYLAIKRMLTISFYQLDSMKEITCMGGFWGPSPFVLSPDGRYIAASSPDPEKRAICDILSFFYKESYPLIKALPWQKAVVVNNVFSGRNVCTFPEYSGLVGQCDFSNDSKLLAIPYEGAIYIHSIPDGKLIRKIDTAATIVKFSPGGEWLASCQSINLINPNPKVQLWNTQDWTIAQEYEIPRAIGALIFSPDGEYLVLGTSFGGGSTINIINIKKNKH